MSHLKQGEARVFDSIAAHFASIPGGIEHSGELAYILCAIIDVYLKQHDLHEKSITDVIGALERAKLDIHHRKVVPFDEYLIPEDPEHLG